MLEIVYEEQCPASIIDLRKPSKPNAAVGVYHTLQFP